MKQKVHYLLLSLLLLVTSILKAQEPYVFELITEDVRAVFGDVHSLYEDDKGIIWMGIYSKGLAYYDGENIIRYPLANEEKFANMPEVFLGHGNFLYLNDGDQVRVFDPIVQDEPKIVSLPTNLPKGNLKNIAIIEQGDEVYIIGAFALKNAENTTEYQLLISKNHQAFESLNTPIIETDGEPIIKSKGTTLLAKTKKGIAHITLNGEIKKVDKLPALAMRNVTAFNFKVFQNGEIVIGNKCTGDNYCSVWVKTDDDQDFALESNQGEENHRLVNFSTDFIRVITEYDDLFGINYRTKNKTTVTKKYSNSRYSEGVFFTIIKSKSGIFWLGTNNGLGKLVPQPNAFQMLPGIGMRNMVEDSAGYVYGNTHWFENGQTMVSMNKYDPKTAEISRKVMTDYSQHWHQASYYQDQIYYNHFRFTPATSEYDTFPAIYEEMDMSYMSLIDRQGKLWKSHWGESKFYIYDVNTGEKQREIAIPLALSKSADFNDLYQRPSDGTIWLATYGQGVFVFSEEGTFLYQLNRSENSRVVLRSNIVSGIYEDKQHNMWLGHGAGLSCIASDFTAIKHYTFDKNNPESRLVYSILPEDDDRFLWLSTSKGLFRFDSQTGDFMDFPLHPTMMDYEFNRMAYLKASNGQFYFGTGKAEMPTVSFFPAQVLKSYSEVTYGKSHLILTAFSKFDHESAQVVEVNRGLQELEEIVLAPGDRYFSLSFALTNHRSPQNNYYSFYLENLDKDWNTPARFNNQVRYENLAPGTYILRMLGALIPDNIAQNETQLIITVLPYWYQTKWLKIALVILLFVLGYGVYRYSLKLQADRLERKRLQDISELKTRLYTNITHEFRTPLTVIMGMNENIQGHQQERTLIKRNAKSLLNLINQLLDLSKLDAGALEVELVQGDMILYLKYLTESFYSMAQDKHVSLYFSADLEQLVMDYDEVKWQHLIYNLLSNAIKFTPSGGEVRLSVDQLIKNDEPFIEVRVTDTGVGISRSHLTHVFDRFYQVEKKEQTQVSSTYAGTGIGLALTKELVELMGGTISVQSELNVGTTFCLQLPIQQKAKKISDAIAIHPPEQQEERSIDLSIAHLNTTIEEDKPKLLLIEDNSGVVAYIQLLLTSQYDLEIAVNGQEGIEKAIEQVPDIIISDVMMPEKNGFEVCETLKTDERTSHIPIILLTAKADSPSKMIGLTKGADAYLSKPFEKEELLIRLQKLVELRNRLQTYYTTTETKLIPPKAPEKPLENAFMTKVNELLVANMQNSEFTVGMLAEKMNLSQTQCYRKLKALTGQAPTHYLRQVRLAKSLELLQTTALNISEIAYTVGFNDPNYFTRTFKKVYGKAPGEFKVTT